jgi:4,5-DOPA dioxygenase extradiol
MPKLMPAIFFGHGNPMNAVLTNGYTESWRRIGAQTLKPKGILAISAHWYVSGTGAMVSNAPRTIHDFGGFPPELFRVQYPAPGDPQLDRRVKQLLAPHSTMSVQDFAVAMIDELERPLHLRQRFTV